MFKVIQSRNEKNRKHVKATLLSESEAMFLVFLCRTTFLSIEHRAVFLRQPSFLHKNSAIAEKSLHNVAQVELLLSIMNCFSFSENLHKSHTAKN